LGYFDRYCCPLAEEGAITPISGVWVKCFLQIACYDWAEIFPKINFRLSPRPLSPIYIYILLFIKT